MPNPRTPLALLSLLLVGCSTTVVQGEPTVTVTYKRTVVEVHEYCKKWKDHPVPCEELPGSGSIICKADVCEETGEIRNEYHPTERMPAATFDLKMKYEPGFTVSVLSFR